jgi:hypothetical protein
MVVVVADAILEACRRARRLDAPDEPLGDEQTERVVHGLEGDAADLRPHDVRDGVGRDVGPAGDRPQHGQSLRGDLNAVLAKEGSRIATHHPPA